MQNQEMNIDSIQLSSLQTLSVTNSHNNVFYSKTWVNIFLKSLFLAQDAIHDLVLC